MNVDAITVDLVTRTLRAWRKAQEPPPDLLALDALWQPTAVSPTERAILLRDYIERLVVAELAAARQAESLPSDPTAHTRSQLRLAVARDFGTAADLDESRNAVLRSWSALYYRYLSAVPFETEELAAAVPIASRQFLRYTEAGVRRLTDLLRREEMAAHSKALAISRRRHLPPADYAQLFGTYAQRTALADLLRQTDGPQYISLEGLGGIGKTALARAVAFDLAETSDFDGIVWISARQTWLNESGTIDLIAGAADSLADVVNRLADQLGLTVAGLATGDKLARLSSFLHTARFLIVIDNLESVRDVDALIPALTTLAGPSRYLFTSRQSMAKYPLVYRRSVEPLSRQDSADLVESELRRRDLAITVTTADMDRLYDLSGGMPLALKLVVAQMSLAPLNTLLDDLRQARHRTHESLYRYIYRRTWLALSYSARELLISLLDIAPGGETLEWLRLVSALSPNEFSDALSQLLAYSLLDAAGSADAPHYRLHRLTATFLQTDVLSDWSDPQTDSA